MMRILVSISAVFLAFEPSLASPVPVYPGQKVSARVSGEKRTGEVKESTANESRGRFVAERVKQKCGRRTAEVEALGKDAGPSRLRGVALRPRYGESARKAGPGSVAVAVPGTTAWQKRRNVAIGLDRKPIRLDQSAALQRMATSHRRRTMGNQPVHRRVAGMPGNVPNVNGSTPGTRKLHTGSYVAKGAPTRDHSQAIRQLEPVRRVFRLSPCPDKSEELLHSGLGSARSAGDDPGTSKKAAKAKNPTNANGGN